MVAATCSIIFSCLAPMLSLAIAGPFFQFAWIPDGSMPHAKHNPAKAELTRVPRGALRLVMIIRKLTPFDICMVKRRADISFNEGQQIGRRNLLQYRFSHNAAAQSTAKMQQPILQCTKTLCDGPVHRPYQHGRKNSPNAHAA